MQSNLYRIVLVTLLVLLVTSCSSVESEPDGVWNGVWRLQSQYILMEARLTQQGDSVTGTFEHEVGEEYHHTFLVEATVKDTLATGVMIATDSLALAPGLPYIKNMRKPFQLAMQGDSIQIFFHEASSFPFLRKVEG